MLLKFKSKLFLSLVTIVLFGIFYLFYNGITVSSGITQITPINVSENGFFCNTKTITAARNSGGNTLMISNSGIKYIVKDEKAYNYLKNNIGKSVIVNYDKKSFYYNPCITSEYVITSIKE